MPRQIYLNNWQEQLESAIKDVANQASTYPSMSPERETLLAELGQLGNLRHQVREISPDEREEVKSIAIARSTREYLQLPEELMSRLGDLFDSYRRFRTRLSWDP